MRKRSRLLGSLIISILLVSSIGLVNASLLSDTWEKITGFVIRPTASATCADTDNGNSPWVNGIVTYFDRGRTKNYQDICVTDKRIKEYFCTGVKASYEIHICQGGVCINDNCAEICIPNCAGKACGEDGCGESCGTCSNNAVCREGICEINTAD